MNLDLACPYCGFSKNIPHEKIPANAREATCPNCEQKFDLPTLPPGTRHEHDGSPIVEPRNEGDNIRGEETLRMRSPWERRGGLGIWQAIYQNTKAVLFSPKRFFSSLSIKGGYGEPLAFGLIAGSVGSMFGLYWNVLMGSAEGHSMMDMIMGFDMGLGVILGFLFIPIKVVMLLFVYSVICHLFLSVLRGAVNGFEASFRVICYAQAVYLLAFIPFTLAPVFGPWTLSLWSMIASIVGMKEIHETSYPKVIFSFLIPFAILVLLAIGASLLIVSLTGQQRLDPLWY